MPNFSATSRARLDSCDVALQRLMEQVVQAIDITVLEGHRSEEQHAANVAAGKSRAVTSKHCLTPSRAVDVAPWPIPKAWGSPGADHMYTGEEMKERAKFYYVAGIVLGLAHRMGIQVRWGGDWDSDREFTDQTFDDLVHFELV